MSEDPRKENAMKVLSPASRRNETATRPASRSGLWLLTAGSAAALVCLAVRPGPSNHVRAADQGPSGEAASSPAGESRQAFVRQARRILKEYDARLIGLAALALPGAGSLRGARDSLVNLQIATRTAESSYLNAKLEREVAEIALREYTEATVGEEKAAREKEFKLADDDLERARRDIVEAKKRLAWIQARPDSNTTLGTHLVYTYTDQLKAAELAEPNATLAVERAERQKRDLLEFKQHKRLLELQAEIKGAHSRELARQAEWELAKGRIAQAQQSPEQPESSASGKRILALLDRAVPIEARLHARLDQLVEPAKADESLQKEIRDLTNELEAIIDEAEAVKAASDFARIGPRIQAAARRSGAARPR
jgi:hypothetical protein